VLVLNLTIAMLALLVHAFTGIYGFVRGPRKTAVFAMIPTGDDYA
jgi:hypothetical protein